MAARQELQDMKLKDVYAKVALPDDEFNAWMTSLGLLHARMACDSCHQDMTLEGKGDDSTKIWVCNRRRCLQAEKGYKMGIFFENVSLPTKKISLLSYFWANKLGTVEKQKDVCAEHFTANPEHIGGTGVVVEINETCVSKRKYQRGRLIRPNQWLFGGIERGSGRCFMVHVDRRDAATLLPIIQDFVRPGATIMSDLWCAYGGIQNLLQG
uniref:ISXO2-like transposase domain-containing protein n=1 Tax=Acrobeloides nanus TaxID=290746 RepID=A0A914CJA9_9BILA